MERWKSHCCFISHLCCCQWQSSPILLLLSLVLEVDSQLQVRTQARDFPLAPLERTVSNLFKKVGGLTWDGAMRGWKLDEPRKTFYFVLVCFAIRHGRDFCSPQKRLCLGLGEEEKWATRTERSQLLSVYCMCKKPNCSKKKKIEVNQFISLAD